jgi:hypothetical protein
MTNFTTLLNRGKRKYIDKYLKKRIFGKCDNCGDPLLLIQYISKTDITVYLCDHCYNKAINYYVR